LSPSADGAIGEVREPAVVAEAPVGGDVLATIQAASVGERMVEPPWDASPGKLREPAAVAERLATGRAAAGPPPAGIGESASRSPVDEAGDTLSVNGDGRPVVDLSGTHGAWIDRGRELSPSADVSTGAVPEPASVAEEPAGGGALGVFQAASVGERMAVEPLAEAPAARSASQPWWLSGSPRDARRLARRRPTSRVGQLFAGGRACGCPTGGQATVSRRSTR
jgi:hypothetical protein